MSEKEYSAKYAFSRIWASSHKTCYHQQLQHFCDKFALSQSDARILVAYNSDCNLLSITSFMKQGPEHSSVQPTSPHLP